MNEIDLQSFVSNFAVSTGDRLIRPLGSGHIHDTYLVESPSANGAFVLQRINHYVFKDIPLLMTNIEKVLAELSLRIDQHRGADLPIFHRWKSLEIVPTRDGASYYPAADGTYWRLYKFIGDGQSVDRLSSPGQAMAGGEALAFFQFLLQDFEPSRLGEVIPDFHNVRKRLGNLDAALIRDTRSRLAGVHAERDAIAERRTRMPFLLEQWEAGLLPLRVTHNDAKFNNVLLNMHNEAISMIDLDTVMPGLTAYDFGDAVRTIINTGAEDEEDPDRIGLNIPYFKAFVQGYASIARHFLTPAEIESLYDGVLLLPYLQAVRFLTDYLEGDVYFKTAYPAHNLVRTRAQLKLLAELEKQEMELREMIRQGFA